MAESVEEFLARGGSINKVDRGVSGQTGMLKDCRCGCKGDPRMHLKLAGHHQRNSPARIHNTGSV